MVGQYKSKIIKETLHLLEAYYNLDRCRNYECLQAGFTTLKIETEKLKGSIEAEKLAQGIDKYLSKSEVHSCLGCDPCEPANILARFYKGESR